MRIRIPDLEVLTEIQVHSDPSQDRSYARSDRHDSRTKRSFHQRHELESAPLRIKHKIKAAFLKEEQIAVCLGAASPSWRMESFRIEPGAVCGACWLLAVGVATALMRRCPMAIAPALSHAWALGKSPVLAIVLFLAMAQVMLASGTADGLAQAVRFALGSAAALATPIFAALFGFLTSSSSSTANGLLMPSQLALSKAGHLSLPWLAALQNVAAAAATMLSPVRIAMGCSLVGVANLQVQVVARAWPLGAMAISVLVATAAALIAISRF